MSERSRSSRWSTFLSSLGIGSGPLADMEGGALVDTIPDDHACAHCGLKSFRRVLLPDGSVHCLECHEKRRA